MKMPLLMEAVIDDEPISTAIAPRSPQPIDIEDLLQWAISRSGRLPWMRDGWRELAMNRGLTARPRRREKIGWDLATVGVGLRLGNGRQIPAQMVPGPDAALVLAAIQRLENPVTVAAVIACARARIRPDWMDGIEPRRVLRPVYGYKRNHKRRGRPILAPAWEPCSPADVKAAREAYSRWHEALVELAARLGGRLSGWTIDGFFARAEPWEPEVEKNA